MQALREAATAKQHSLLALLCLRSGVGDWEWSGSSGPTSGLLGAIKSDEQNIAWEVRSPKCQAWSFHVCERQPSLLPVPIHSPGTVQGTGSQGWLSHLKKTAEELRGRHQNSSKLWWRRYPAESQGTNQQWPSASSGHGGLGIGTGSWET